MDMIGRIRRLHVRDKLSEREIARMTGLSRNTVSKWLRAPVAEERKKLVDLGAAIQPLPISPGPSKGATTTELTHLVRNFVQ